MTMITHQSQAYLNVYQICCSYASLDTYTLAATKLWIAVHTNNRYVYVLFKWKSKLYKGVSVSLSLGLLYTVRMFEMIQLCE